MNKTPQNTASTIIAGRPIEEETIDPNTTLPLDEIRAIHDEKLVAIRHAIDKGDYDSDAILEKALHCMLKRLEVSGNEQ